MATPKYMSEKTQMFYLKQLPGMNSKLDEYDLSDKYARLAQNCIFEEEPLAVTKRPPVSYFNDTTLGTGGIVGVLRYYSSAGMTKWIVAHANKVYVGNDSTGSFTEIRTLANTGKRMAFEVYQDKVIGSNGFDNIWVYDGSSDNLTWELGSCKAKTGAGTGITKTAVSYAVTFDADAVVSGAVSNTIATLTNQDVNLTNIPLGPIGTTDRKIYRKDSSTGGAYKLVTTISNNTATTYTDSNADVSGAATMPVVTDDMPVGNILKLHRERLFISGDPNKPSWIYYSNPYLPHFIQQTSNLDYMEISPNDGDEIMGIPIQLGRMVCIKRNTIRPLYITSPTSGQDPTTWYAEDPTVFSGAVAKWSIVQTSYGIVYLGWDHWYLYDGAGSKPIIDEFDTTDILPSSYSDVIAYENQNILRAAYADNTIGTQYHNRVLCWNFKRNTLNLDTLDVNCFASKSGDDESGDIFYGSSRGGYLLRGNNTELLYRMSDKTSANNGTKTNAFVGGTEANPYIEIGALSAAASIPTDICILWDDQATNPGSGWTEITTMDGRLIFISNAVAPGTTNNAVGISGTTLSDAISKDYRIFRKNGATTEYQFPDGSIVFWDQVSPPDGFASVEESGKYITVRLTMEDDRTFTLSSEVGGGTANNVDNIIEVYLIKKIGEAPSWDGLSQYVYALYYSAAAISNGWTDVTSTYTGHYLKIKSSDVPTMVNGNNTVSKLDWVQLGIVDHNESQTATSDGTVSSTSFSGAFEDGFDRDPADSREWYALHNGDGWVAATLTHIHEWTDEKDISSIYVKMGQGTYGGNYKESWRDYTVFLKISGTWTQVDTSSIHNFGQGSNSVYDETREVTLATGWSNVTGIKVYLYGKSYSYEGDRRQKVWLRIFDVRCEGYLKSVAFHVCRKLLGKMQDWNAAIESTYTAGTWTSPALNLRSLALGLLYWNESILGSDNILFHFRVGDTQANCLAASWSTGITDPNGFNLSSLVTANAWIQYKIEFTATDTMVSNPRVYFSDGYVVRFTYSQAETYAETSVEFIYRTGFRNFDQAFLDKIFKKIVAYYNGTQGSMTVKWETENASNSFVVDLSVLPTRWESFFHDTAMGRNLSIEIYKNDLYDLKLKEVQGAYAMMPFLGGEVYK